MRDLQAIREDNAMTFHAINWYVKDATKTIIADCCTGEHARVIAKLLNEYSKIQAAKNLPLWASSVEVTLGSILQDITKKMEKEDETEFQVMKRDIEAQAPIGTQGKTIWPVDPGYAAWIDHKARYDRSLAGE